MLADADIGYYERREQIERELEAKAVSPEIAKIHRELADRYADRAAAVTGRRRSKLHIFNR